MIISLLICTQIIFTIAEVYNGSVFNQPLHNSPQHIWHSYTFNTGAGNREELHFSNVELKNDFESITGVFIWKSVPFQDQIVVIGLGDDFLVVTTLNKDNNSVAYKEGIKTFFQQIKILNLDEIKLFYTEKKNLKKAFSNAFYPMIGCRSSALNFFKIVGELIFIEIQTSGKALAVFQKWDVKTQEIQSFVIVATYTTEQNFILKWYLILDKRLISLALTKKRMKIQTPKTMKFLWDWSFHGNISYLDIIKINYESKLLIVSSKSSIHKTSAEIYSFSMNNDLDIWLFEKITLDAAPSSVAIFESIDYIFFCAAFPSLEMIHIFKYSKSLCMDTLEKKHFVFHQKIFTIGLKSLKTFRVGFRWYLAVASKVSLIYYLKENLLFQPINNLKLNSVNNWLAISVDTYREDLILLADSNSDVSFLTWIEDKHFRILGSFTEFACRNDANCLEKMERVALNESIAFGYNDLQNIIISTKNGSPLFFKLLVKLKPLSDKVILKLQNILDMKNSLEMNYTNQNEKINQLLSEKKGIAEIKSSNFPAKLFNDTQASETISQTKDWSEVMLDVNQLKATIESLNRDIMNYLKDLKSNRTSQNEKYSNNFLTKNLTDGITFYGDVLITELNLSTINGYDVRKLLTDTFRKNKVSKIGGKKIIKNLNAENVIFEKLGDILACDVVFSDELIEENRNIINGDIIWQNNVNILNDVMILPESTKRSSFSGKISRRAPKYVYDTLNLEELEVTEDIHVERTVNGQPFILPVHSGQLNILDVVNQARIEVVNVKQNLDISFINGKNFSHFLEHLLFKPPTQHEFDSVKVDGVFSAPFLHINQLDNIDSSKGETNFHGDRLNQNIIGNHSKPYIREKNMKKTQYQNMKRTVHVFQNLEVDGILFSNKINNISWVVLNDTVKKDEKTVILTGNRKFEKILVSKKISLSGTLNGRFPDHVLNNFSNQFIRFPQVFEKVKFRNLTLEGAWDGILVNELNNSVVRINSNNVQASDVTFEDECFVNVLNVTDFVNNISLKEKGTNKKTGSRIELKTVNATNVIVHGSLITNNKINNLNFSNFSMFRVSLKSPETVNLDLFYHNLTISGDLNLETFNQNDISSIINSGGDTNLVEKFLNGEIRSIKKLLVKGNISASHGINGFNVSKILEKGICITKPSSLKGNITFENIIYFDNINVTNSIDGFSLRKLEKDIVFKHNHIFLSGPKNFSVIKVKNIKTKTLNDRLVQEIVSLKGDQVMKGPVHINGDVIVKGNITTYAAINDIIVPDLLKSYSTKVNSFIYLGDLNFKSDHITVENLIVSGEIQNVSLEALIHDAALKNENFSISGKKSFKGEVKLRGNVLVEDFIHGVNFSKFYSDVVFINKQIKLEGTIIIKESVLKVLETTGYFNSNLINSFDTNDWLEDSIPLNRYGVIGGKKNFEEVYVLQNISADFINGHLPSAMICLKGKQHIPSLALFPRIHTTFDLSVSGLVNGRNLHEEFQDSVLINGTQTIRGKTLFYNDFIVNGSLLVDTIKGKPVNKLITLNTEQIIKTPLEFKGSVKAKKGVEDLKIINNISLHEWDHNSVLLNRNQVLNGLWTVKGRVKTKNINGEGLLHTVSLPTVSKNFQKGRLMALEMKNATEVEFSDQCHKFEALSKQFSKLPYLFYQFDIVDEIETLSTIDSAITFKINDENHLIITFLNECLSTLYKWNKDSSTFDYLRQLNIGPVSKWSIIYRNEVTYLVTSSLRSSIICEENLQQGNIWIFKDNSEKYAHLLSTNAFVDITHENNTSDEFFTIDANGTLLQWTVQENGNISSKFLLSVGPGMYRFLDFRIMGGLAISNGREIRQITLTYDKVIENNVSFTNVHIVALPIEGKTLVAVVVKDKIVIYENILEDKIFSVIHTYRAGSVLWFNFGLEKQALLIVASHHRLIEVYEYKSISGLVRKMSIQMFSTRLQSETLPVKKKYHPDKFLIVIQKKKLIFIRADMLGDFFKKNVSLC